MAVANVVSVMDGIGDRLAGITGLRVHRYPAEAISPPAAIVDFPDVQYDFTMGRGHDRMEFPVHVIVGKVSDRASALNLGAYMAGSGAASVKATIEGDYDLGDTAATVRVMECTVTVLTVAAVDYLGASFTVEVIS